MYKTVLCILLAIFLTYVRCPAAEPSLSTRAMYRGPVDLVLADNESWAVTVNEISGTVSLLDLSTASVVDELAVGKKPGGLARCSSNEILVSSRFTGEVHRFEVRGGQLVQLAKIDVGYEPLGIACHDQLAYVGLQATGEIAVLDLSQNKLLRRISVGKWPRYLAISKDGKRLAVGLSGQSEVAVVSTETDKILYEEPLSGGINIGHLELSNDGTQVYFPWMIYRTNPINVRNIQLGWVLASRIARIQMDGPKYREAISLDVPRMAVADPFGIAKTPNEHRLAVTSSGTHELLVYRLSDLPFIGTGGPGDLIDRRLMQDPDLFYRIELTGRPMGMEAADDNETVYVANHLLDSIQVVNLESRQVVREISLGQQPADPKEQILHQGMEIFYDAERSLDQWYSCHSCHQDGGSNAKAMDTWNDGTARSNKTVLPLAGVEHTAPWTWHGWQEDLDDSLQKSFVSTMQGKEASRKDIQALRAYLGSLETPPNPFVDKPRDEAAVGRGKELFNSSAVGCSDCHSGSRFTDGLKHDVGMIRDSDKYDGYNTPSLIGVYRKARWLHDGRAKTLAKVFEKWHRPDEIGGGTELTEQQIADLVAYLKTL